eukprot:scaffold13173_cov71-Skeletonema_marinoi.AAC.1
MSSNKESVTGDILVENETDRNEARMFSAFTTVCRMKGKRKMMLATEEEDALMFAGYSRWQNRVDCNLKEGMLCQ